VRGEYAYVASLDGPFKVELEDLPDVVRARAVGVSVTYQLGGTRNFKPAPAALIDVVRYAWYLRRADMATSIARDVLDELAARVPEALPRRFGGYEPLQFKLDVAGAEGFAEQWESESTGPFWRGSRPCLGGSTFGLARELGRPPIPYPVGDITLSFDGRAIEDERWRQDLVELFLATVETTRAFCAVTQVDHNIGYSGGNLWHGPEAETQWGSVVRSEWQGLPAAQPWLLWVGPMYKGLVESDLGVFEPQGNGLLLQRSSRRVAQSAPRRLPFVGRPRPADSRDDPYSAVPEALRLVATGSPVTVANAAAQRSCRTDSKGVSLIRRTHSRTSAAQPDPLRRGRSTPSASPWTTTLPMGPDRHDGRDSRVRSSAQNDAARDRADVLVRTRVRSPQQARRRAIAANPARHRQATKANRWIQAKAANSVLPPASAPH
jgi:hypothetical protein